MLPFYPFFWGDYIQKTAHLSQTQHGAYMLFLRHLYGTGQLIEDKQRYRIAQAFTDEEKEAADFVLKSFFKDSLKDSLKIWRNEKCEAVIDKANDLHARKVAGGSAGGLKRAQNQKNNLSTPLSTPSEIAKDSLKDASSNSITPKLHNSKSEDLKTPPLPPADQQNVNNSVDNSERGSLKQGFNGVGVWKASDIEVQLSDDAYAKAKEMLLGGI